MFFTGRTPFLPPNQQRQSTEGNRIVNTKELNKAKQVLTVGMQSVYANSDFALSSMLTWYRMHSTISAWFSLPVNGTKTHQHSAADFVELCRLVTG